jgi:NAD(P) transhydrogenase subunit alpha
MATTFVIPKEIKKGEDRVAIVPVVVDKLIKAGAKIKIQHNAGEGVYLDDAAFEGKGAEIVADAKDLFASGEVVIKVNAPTEAEIEQMKAGSTLICLLYPHQNPQILQKLCAKRITCLALEMIPRISRAQIMDVLSTQATVIGYKAVLIAAATSKFFFPMLSTGAGTMRPAKVIVIGIGVAGLQAIATARRLGARVEAYDVRPETRQEAESLGAKFIDTGVTASGAGGYARELTAEEKQQQQAILEKHIAESDVVITTAGVPGRPAPKILSKAMVEKMHPGALVVDAMAEMGGNCELTKAGETVNHNNVAIVGVENIVSSLGVNASEMFAKNVLNYLTPMLKDGQLALNWEDEIIASSCATRDGQIVNEALKKLAEKQ